MVGRRHGQVEEGNLPEHEAAALVWSLELA